MKILIVEDSRANMLVLTTFIERFGMTALQAETGQKAVDLFTSESPDIVLLDVVLPDMDGFEIARQIRDYEHGDTWTPIIFLSSLGKDEDIERGIAAGGDDYLLKPVSEIVLGAKIRAMQRIIQMRTSLVVLARKLDLANQELKRLSAIDGLTGIPNRRYFDETLSREWRRARRNQTSISLMMCDVDLFKRYNDALGHQAGDDCLRQVAALLSANMQRPSDTAARYGGEEFVAILPETASGGAIMVGEKVRHALHQAHLPHPEAPLGFVTLSIGIATLQPAGDDGPETLIRAADQALYRAKHEGRDRVCVAGKA
ncbi:diguanylate cyclase [Dechloromonas sp. ZS-1]|uniref:GGDEF domain-containing response regulator n=1 Tax=Dechloromonas sp. ZS-1 TaxID=3138067 RepID=UPI0031FE0EE4